MSFSEVLKLLGLVWIIVIALLPILIVMRSGEEETDATIALQDEEIESDENDFSPRHSLPFAKDVAARQALEAMPQPPLSRVMMQAEASRRSSGRDNAIGHAPGEKGKVNE